MAEYEDVKLYVDAVKIMEGVSADWDLKYSSSSTVTFQGSKTKTGPAEVTVKISKITVDAKEDAKLIRRTVMKINDKNNKGPVIIENDYDTLIFPNPKAASIRQKLAPDSDTMDFEFTADYPEEG